MMPQPSTCSPNSASEPALELTKLFTPIITNPKIAKEQPTKCRLSITIFSKIREKMRVVIIAPLCSSLYVEPEMKFKAKYCMTDSVISQNPGTRK